MSKYGIILLGICLLDGIGSLIGIHIGYMNEFNPILKFFLINWGLMGFIFSKIICFTLVPITFLEMNYKRHLKLVTFGYRFVIIAYLILFSSIFVLINF